MHVVSIQQITLMVRNQGGLEGYLTIVYGLNTHRERLVLCAGGTTTTLEESARLPET